MSEMMSVCGLLCNECDAFIATKDDDDNKRAEVAQLWSQQYDADLKPEDINCDGCTSDSERLFAHCKGCEIRKCARPKAIENCAHCDEYACEKVEKIFQMVPEAKKRLDVIRAAL